MHRFSSRYCFLRSALRYKSIRSIARNECPSPHANQVVKLLEDYKYGSDHLSLNGNYLTISDIHSLFTGKFHSASLTAQAWEALKPVMNTLIRKYRREYVCTV